MSVGGAGIPRLQDLSYIEVAVAQLAVGATFEHWRALVTRAAELARDSDSDGSFDERPWEAMGADTTKHVYNTVEVLKELCAFAGLNGTSYPPVEDLVYLHTNDSFTLTALGAAWAAGAR